jgi:hypothetical protein
MSWQYAGAALWMMVLIEWAHIVSPVVLAWSHPGLRQIALSRPVETLLLPAIGFASCILGPFAVVQWTRYAWHCWHFGSQHYGVCRLLGWRVNRWAIVIPTAGIMASVFVIHLTWWRWLVIIAIDLQHWLVDVGLSTVVARWRWAFLGALIILGVAGLYWKTIQLHYQDILMLTMKARWGLDVTHYLYSRWVWKLSDPEVRAMIGKELFGAKAIRP